MRGPIRLLQLALALLLLGLAGAVAMDKGYGYLGVVGGSLALSGPAYMVCRWRWLGLVGSAAAIGVFVEAGNWAYQLCGIVMTRLPGAGLALGSVVGLLSSLGGVVILELFWPSDKPFRYREAGLIKD